MRLFRISFTRPFSIHVIWKETDYIYRSTDNATTEKMDMTSEQTT